MPVSTVTSWHYITHTYYVLQKSHALLCFLISQLRGLCKIENHKIIHVNQTTDTALVHTSCMNNERVVPQFAEVTQFITNISPLLSLLSRNSRSLRQSSWLLHSLFTLSWFDNTAQIILIFSFLSQTVDRWSFRVLFGCHCKISVNSGDFRKIKV